MSLFALRSVHNAQMKWEHHVELLNVKPSIKHSNCYVLKH